LIVFLLNIFYKLVIFNVDPLHINMIAL